MTIDVVYEDPRWQEAGLGDLAEAAEHATLAFLGLDPDLCEVAVLACDDARIAELNAEFREKPTPTNVLSWPSEERATPARVPMCPNLTCRAWKSNWEILPSPMRPAQVRPRRVARLLTIM